jgi:hypothetical protein
MIGEASGTGRTGVPGGLRKLATMERSRQLLPHPSRGGIDAAALSTQAVRDGSDT